MGNEITLFTEVKNKMYCSVSTESVESKKQLFNALESCDALLNDCVGSEISIKDIYVEEREGVDDTTGEVKTKFRTILFDENGQTYATGSYGVYNAIKKIITIYGLPTSWKEPVKVKVSKKNIGNGKSSLTLILV